MMSCLRISRSKKLIYLLLPVFYSFGATGQGGNRTTALSDLPEGRETPSLRGDYPGKAISIYPGNTFYFQDEQGKPILLIGDYAWDTFSDTAFDYVRMFDALHARGLNFARVWLWKLYAWNPADSTRNICPYLRKGPGTANDGRPKYNLDQYNPAFFDRLRDMCEAARNRGIYLQLILLDTWMLKHDDLWRLAAFQRDNNVNHVDGDPRQTGRGKDGEQGYCSLGNAPALRYQKAYIRRVVEAVNAYGNIFFEIANENYYNKQWELTLCDFIKAVESEMPRQHMTVRRDFPGHHDVVQSWDPEKVHRGILSKHELKVPLIFDTDWTLNKAGPEVRKAAWSALAAGAHFDYMEGDITYRKDTIAGGSGTALHRQIGYMARFMKKVSPWTFASADELVSSGSAMVMAGKEKLWAYLPEGGSVTLDLSGLSRSVSGQWYDPRSGKFSRRISLRPDKITVFRAPDRRDWVLFLASH